MLAPDILVGLSPQPAVLLLALAIDAIAGDPAWLYRRMPHPVQLIGRLISLLDHRLNRDGLSPEVLRRRGLVATVILVLAALVFGALLHLLLAALPWGWVAEAVLASSLLAARGLYDAVARVAGALPHGLPQARKAIALIVGRDPDSLDDAGISRAAIESLAENFSDGVAAPLFWYAVLGLPGLCAYKAINTADSMIGHRTARHLHFGRASAKLDDAANLLPARLSGALICVAAAMLPGGDARAAWTAMRRDARGHRSPNAGWPEAAMAGALGLALAGPRRYDDLVVDDPWMGDGRREATSADIHRALSLYILTNALLAGLLAFLLAL